MESFHTCILLVSKDKNLNNGQTENTAKKYER